MNRLDERAYSRLFESNAEGKAVFEELCKYFYDQSSYVRGDTHHMAFNEGSKEVIRFILKKMAKAIDNGEQEENE